MVSNSEKPLGSVLVTGGCGFLGSHIVSLLISRYSSPSTTVSVLDLRTSENTYPEAKYHAADLTSASAVREVLEQARPNVIIHTASPVAVGSLGKKGEELMYKVNVEGTKILLEESNKIGVKCFVYTSSASVISDMRTDLINADERWNVIGGSIQKEYYTQTKAEAEQLVLEANNRTGGPSSFLTCALRPSAMFGERDVQLIPGMLGALHTGRTGFQLGANDNLFDFTYVGNVAHAHLLAASRLLSLPSTPSSSEKDSEEPSADGEAFIITNASPIFFWDFARYLWQRYHALRTASATPSHLLETYHKTTPALLAKTREIPFGLAMFIATIASWVCAFLRLNPPKLQPPSVRFSCMTRYFSVGKAQELLDYDPIYTLQEGVERSAAWFVERDRDEETKKSR